MSVTDVSSVAVSALLNPADSLLRAQPLRTWSQAQQDAVRERLSAVHRDWCVEWLRDGNDNGLSASLDFGLTDQGVALGRGNDEFASWSFDPPPRRAASSDPPTSERPGSPDDAIRALALHMFAFDIGAPVRHGQEPARMAPALARAAWSDWLFRLQGLLGGGALSWVAPAGENAAHLDAKFWSGSLWACWSWCGGTWHLALSHDAGSVVLGMEHAQASFAGTASASAPTPKHTLDQVLSGQRVALRVMLDGAELSLGQLQSLRIGDVVTVRHALDAPAHLTDMQGTRLCDGWLGQSEARVAVELTLPASAT